MRHFFGVAIHQSYDRALDPHPWYGNYVSTYEVSNLYFWRDRSGHEVDVLIDRGTRLSPLEIKSGRTVNRDYFKGLEFWRKLSGESAG